MTRMIPDVIHPDVKSRAERRIFEWIKSAPGSENWICMHSLAIAKHNTQRAGEIDFLLITNHVVLVLEVKGGRVERSEGTWRHTNRYGDVHQTNRSPFEQARQAMFSIEKRLRHHFGRDHELTSCLLGYGVIAPDCALRESIDCYEGAESSEAVIDCNNMQRGVPWCIQQLTAFNRGLQKYPRREPRRSDAKSIVKFLRGDFDAVVPLHVRARDVHEQYLALEQEQYDVLDILRDERRLIVDGSAGTGKTVLALESARRAAWDGSRVLFLCFNRFLSTYLKQFLVNEQVDVHTIHSVARKLVMRSSERDTFASAEENVTHAELFSTILPKLAPLAALEIAEDSYDVVVVDEAQDLLEQWTLDVIDAVLKDGLEDGSWRVFLDSNNQAAVYGHYDELLHQRLQRLACRQRLTQNVRNTRQIAEESYTLSRPEYHAKARVEGSSVTYIWYETPSQQASKIGLILDQLITNESADPESITLLSPFRVPSWLEFYNGKHTIAPLIDSQNQSSKSSVCYATVPSYKGLENDVVILTDIDSLDSDRDRAIAYVGLTRARVQLYVLLPEELRPEYRMLVLEQFEDENEDQHV